MIVSYNGQAYDILGYIPASQRLRIRLRGQPDTPIKRVGITPRVVGLTPRMREELGIPLERIPQPIPRWITQRIRPVGSQEFFAQDPIIDTEE